MQIETMQLAVIQIISRQMNVVLKQTKVNQ